MRILKIAVLSCIFFAAGTFASTPAPRFVLAKIDKGQVEFEAIGRPSMLKIHGVGVAPEGQFRIENGALRGSASFDLSTLDTGIGLRNRHMKEKYLETEKYPQATLRLENVPLGAHFNETDAATLEKIPFSAKLLLHGVEKSVQGEARIQKKNTSIEVVARFSIKIADFAIPTPGFAGITMADEVNVSVAFSGSAAIETTLETKKEK